MRIVLRNDAGRYLGEDGQFYADLEDAAVFTVTFASGRLEMSPEPGRPRDRFGCDVDLTPVAVKIGRVEEA
jgi:hypothetical protein